MSDATERAAFEAWYSIHGTTKYVDENGNITFPQFADGTYYSYHINSVWQGWHAALRSIGHLSACHKEQP